MDWLTFISNIIESLAWPATVLVLALILSRDLPGLVQSLRKLKYKDFELEFGESAKAVEQEAKKALPPGSMSDAKVQAERERLERVASAAPRSAILEAWLQVESAAVDAIRKKHVVSFTSSPGPQRLAQYLMKSELLTDEQLDVFEHLRFLRNQAVHAVDAQFTKESVRGFIKSALSLAVYLRARALEI